MVKAKPERQSPEDMMIEIARGLYGSRAGSRNEIEAKIFADAARKVGRTSNERLSWAIKFAQDPIESMTPGDLYNAQIEMGAFLNRDLAFRPKENKSVPFCPVFFPFPEQITEIKQKFLLLIGTAAAETRYSFPASQLNISLGPGGISYDLEYKLSEPEELRKARIEAAMLGLAQLLGERWGYIGLCDRKRHGCGRYFLKSRKDREFCTKTCLNRSTTYRQRGKEPTA